jgi:hypothetical protein
VLLGEQDVPTQKGRDAKRDVLTPKAMHKVKQGIKQAAKKQRRRMDKDSVDEGAVKDYLMDLEDDATKMSKDDFVKKHGEGKANIWDKVNSPDYKDISDLMDGNEFAKKVTDLKAKGAKPGTKFKTSDGKEHTLEDLVEKMMLVRDQVAKAVADKVQDWAKGASIDQINKVLAMIKSGAKLKPEGPQSASIEEDAITEEQFEQLAEKKDACYYKVKSRYKVWPSAYASGALVQCRKVGAKNWGNKSKK